MEKFSIYLNFSIFRVVEWMLYSLLADRIGYNVGGEWMGTVKMGEKENSLFVWLNSKTAKDLGAYRSGQILNKKHGGGLLQSYMRSLQLSRYHFLQTESGIKYMRKVTLVLSMLYILPPIRNEKRF